MLDIKLFNFILNNFRRLEWQITAKRENWDEIINILS